MNDKTYFIITDTHGFYTPTMQVLNGRGFEMNNPSHTVLLCGDLLDRGKEAVKLQQFAMRLHNENRLIFIRGNHEDLILQMIRDWDREKDKISIGYSHHFTNGTYDTALQLTGMKKREAEDNEELFLSKLNESDFVKILIPSSIDYYELNDFIFVHGWIPTDVIPLGQRTDYTKRLAVNLNWRNCATEKWEEARWENGIEAAVKSEAILKGKTIVCGHWHCSTGHYLVGEAKSERGDEAIYTPFVHEGIIAFDACTILSGKVNCLKLEYPYKEIQI